MQNETHKTVSIIGCGWLGLPLAEQLVAASGRPVKGSTTSPGKLEILRSAGVQPYLASLTPEPQGDNWQELLAAHTLVVDIPPRASAQGEAFHPQQIRFLAEWIEKSPIREILYISSTSVYPEQNQLVREEDVISPAQSAAAPLVEAERTLLALRQTGKKVAIVRCGGLMGYDRIPGKYVRGKKNMTTGHIPVNYVHRDDAVAILSALIVRGIPNDTFNVVAPVHPSRREVYEASCRAYGWEAPTFAGSDSSIPFKLVSSEKITAFLGYSFLYPDPLHFYYTPRQVLL